MWPDRVSNPGPPTYESGALPIALRGPQGGMNIHKALFLPVVTLTGDDDGIIQELEKNKLC